MNQPKTVSVSIVFAQACSKPAVDLKAPPGSGSGTSKV